MINLAEVSPETVDEAVAQWSLLHALANKRDSDAAASHYVGFSTAVAFIKAAPELLVQPAPGVVTGERPDEQRQQSEQALQLFTGMVEKLAAKGGQS